MLSGKPRASWSSDVETESADFETILTTLARHDVDFVLVGALAAVVQGGRGQGSPTPRVSVAPCRGLLCRTGDSSSRRRAQDLRP
jgi:hypothetical protein